MSVDFNECKYCYESIYEGNCYTRVIESEHISVCDWCINEEIDNGHLFKLNKDSEKYETLTEEEKENIDNYGCIYKMASSGKEKRIKEIDEEIQTLQKEKEKLLKL